VHHHFVRSRIGLAGAFVVATVALASQPALAVTKTTKAPKVGAACATKDVGKKSGSLVCTKSGTKAAWQAAPATTVAPAPSPAPTTAAPAPAPTTPKELKSVAVTVAAAYTALPTLAAIDQGFDKKNGIEIKPFAVASGADLARGLISGDLKIAVNTPPNILALLEQNLDVALLGTALQGSQFDIVIRSDVATPNADSGWIGVMKDLAGKRIGVIARGVAAEEIAKSLFKSAGVDPNGQTYIATGLAPTTLAALTNKTIDAAVNVEPTISLAVQQGVGKAPFALRRSEGPDILNWPGLYATSTRDWAKANPDVVKAYLATLEEGIAWVENPANKAAVYKLMKDKLGADQPLADILIKDNKGAFPKSTKIDVKGVQAFLDWGNESGNFLQRKSPASLIFTP
jgi:NitT/TauT family transport system substrate-binding protein